MTREQMEKIIKNRKSYTTIDEGLAKMLNDIRKEYNKYPYSFDGYIHCTSEEFTELSDERKLEVYEKDYKFLTNFIRTGMFCEPEEVDIICRYIKQLNRFIRNIKGEAKPSYKLCA